MLLILYISKNVVSGTQTIGKYLHTSYQWTNPHSDKIPDLYNLILKSTCIIINLQCCNCTYHKKLTLNLPGTSWFLANSPSNDERPWLGRDASCIVAGVTSRITTTGFQCLLNITYTCINPEGCVS